MARLEAGIEVKTTTKPLELLSSEKALVKIDARCLWTEVLEDQRKIGAVIHGPAEYIIDAIVDTREGAMGQSFKGEIKGFKLYLGGTNLEEASAIATQQDLQRLVFDNREAFITAANTALDRLLDSCSCKIEQTQEPQQGILMWEEEGRKRNAIFANRDNTGFIQRGKVFLASGKRNVYVSDGTVILSGRHGRELFVDKGMIVEPEVLRNLGPRVSDIVNSSLADLNWRFRHRL